MSSSNSRNSASMGSSVSGGGGDEKWMFLAAATMATAGMLYYLLKSTTTTQTDDNEGVVVSSNDDELEKKKKSIVKTTTKTTKQVDDEKVEKDVTTTIPKTATTTTTTTIIDDKSTTITSPTKPDVDMDEKHAHAIIEEIDKKGKTLFKNKQYLEAATVFTEAIDFILQRISTVGTGKDASGNSKDASLAKQLVTLLNNRSAMYEKANILELALEDCSTILQRDMEHNKARVRKLRILEQLKRYNDALVEVCAMQLLFMQANRVNLRMGIPLPPPPVSQTKMEELLAEVLPGEMSKFLSDLEQKRKGSKNDKLGQPLPSPFTILQLLRSYTGYNVWMAAAAKDGTIEKLTSDIPLSVDTDDAIALKATLLFKRGRRYVYERKYDMASQDFEDAYQLINDNDTAQAIMIQNSATSSTEEDTGENFYARLIEWTGMVRHWHYELDSSIECYQKCSTLEPDNAILLVKQAGVQLDATNHDTALELFEKALSIDPKCVDALLHRSNLRMMQAQANLAQTDLEECIKIRPNYVMARLRLAAILAATDAETAMKQLDMAEYTDPISSEVQSYRGEVYFTQGEMDKAVEQFEKAMKLEPQNPTPYVNAAMAILNTPLSPSSPVPDTERVITLLEKAVSIDPQFTAAYIHLGQLKLGTAQNLQAARDVIDLYNRALEYCRTPEEVKELCGMRCLAVAQVEAATQLNMETFNAM